MMVDRDGKLTVIDFDRDDYGDPWEEFNRIVWCAQASEAFASGMIDGYFNGEVPMEFWNLLALYIASNSLSSLPWAVAYGEREIAVMQQQAAQVLSWYRNMTQVVPTWYRRRK
jgi:aminoglycoside phosphotransferase (APT) family kinase protein